MGPHRANSNSKKWSKKFDERPHLGERIFMGDNVIDTNQSGVLQPDATVPSAAALMLMTLLIFAVHDALMTRYTFQCEENLQELHLPWGSLNFKFQKFLI